MDKSDLFYQFGSHNHLNRRTEMKEAGRCCECFLPLQLCICANVAKLFEESTFTPRANLLIYMHNKEWGRTSNTGKLMVKGMPEHSQLHLYGIKDQQEALIDKLNSGPSLILYPSKNSTSISDYKEMYANQNGTLNICVLDATWAQSHTMEKSLPAHIPRVQVDDFILKASEFLNRKQSQADRVSTIEAVMIALQTLGESPERLRPMQEALRLSVDAVNRLRGKKEHFGHNFVSSITACGDVTNGPYTKSTIVRPESCPHCMASHTTTIFKNVGARKGHYDPNFMAKKEAAKISETALSMESKVEGGVEEVERVSEDASVNSESSAPVSGKFHRAWKCQACKEVFHVNSA